MLVRGLRVCLDDSARIPCLNRNRDSAIEKRTGVVAMRDFDYCPCKRVGEIASGLTENIYGFWHLPRSPSHLRIDLVGPGSLADHISDRKLEKYRDLLHRYDIRPFAVETLGAMSKTARDLSDTHTPHFI